MTTNVLAIGIYSETDRAALENEFSPYFSDGPGDIAAIPEE